MSKVKIYKKIRNYQVTSLSIKQLNILSNLDLKMLPKYEPLNISSNINFTLEPPQKDRTKKKLDIQQVLQQDTALNHRKTRKVKPTQLRLQTNPTDSEILSLEKYFAHALKDNIRPKNHFNSEIDDNSIDCSDVSLTPNQAEVLALENPFAYVLKDKFKPNSHFELERENNNTDSSDERSTSNRSEVLDQEKYFAHMLKDNFKPNSHFELERDNNTDSSDIKRPLTKAEVLALEKKAAYILKDKIKPKHYLEPKTSESRSSVNSVDSFFDNRRPNRLNLDKFIDKFTFDKVFASSNRMENDFSNAIKKYVLEGIENATEKVKTNGNLMNKLVLSDVSTQNNKSKPVPLDIDKMLVDLHQQGTHIDRVIYYDDHIPLSESDDNDEFTQSYLIDQTQRKKFKTQSSLPDNEKYKLILKNLFSLVSDQEGKSVLKYDDDVPEMLISLFPHGILQVLFVISPEIAVDIIEKRVKKLRETETETFETWFNGNIKNKKDKDNFLYALNADFIVLEQYISALKKNNTNIKFQYYTLNLLKRFEVKYNIFHLESQVDSLFLVNKGKINSDIFGTNLNQIKCNHLIDVDSEYIFQWDKLSRKDCKKRSNVLKGIMCKLALVEMSKSKKSVFLNTKNPPIVVGFNTPELYQDRIYKEYIKKYPELVFDILRYIILCNVKKIKSDHNKHLAQLVLKENKNFNGTQSLSLILDYLKQKNISNPILTQLKKELMTYNLTQLFNEIECFNTNTSLSNLLKIREKIHEFKFFSDEISGININRKIQTINNKENQVSAQLIHNFFRTQLSENSNSIFPKTVFLNLPNVDHIIAVLSDNTESKEKQFYLSTMKLITATILHTQNGNYQNSLSWTQCCYDMLYHQQELIIDIMDNDKPNILLQVEDFEKNILLLKEFSAIRKQLGVRPYNPDSYEFYSSYLNFIWQDEEPIEDVIAERYRKWYLKKLKYDFHTECSIFFHHLYHWGKKGTRNIAYRAKKLIADVKNYGLSNVLSILNQKKEGLISHLLSQTSEIQEDLIQTLSVMLKAAQQNPKFFRIIWGDFSLLIPQLKNLFGQDPSLITIIQNIDLCIRSQAMASEFSGDIPKQFEQDPLNDPELANVIKKFQFFRDMVSLIQTGIPFLELFINFSSKTLVDSLTKLSGDLISTYIVRQTVNNMKPPVMRLYNNLRTSLDLMPTIKFGLTPNHLISLLPEKPIQLASHIGQNKNVFFGIINYCLEPIKNRVIAYKNRIKEVKSNPNDTEAQNALKNERIKIACIFGLSSFFSFFGTCFANTFKFMVIFSNPLLTSFFIGCLTFISCCYLISRYLNKYDDIFMSVSETISYQMKRIFVENSTKVSAIINQIKSVSKNIIEQMSQVDNTENSGLSSWKQKNTLLELSHYWDKLSYSDDVEKQIVSSIEQKDLSELKNDAWHILKFVRVKKIIDRVIDDNESINLNQKQLNDLNKELTSLHFHSLDDTLYPYQLLNLKEEIHSYLEHLCGTITPGNHFDEIFSTLKNYHIAMQKGEHIFNVLHMQHINSSAFEASCHSHEQYHNMNCSSSRMKSTHLPDQFTAKNIMEDVRRKCEHSIQKKEEVLQETRMKLVMKRALYQYLQGKDQYAESSLPDFSADPLFKAFLKVEMNELEKANTPWNQTFSRLQTRNDQIHQPKGCTYNILDAALARSAEVY